MKILKTLGIILLLITQFNCNKDDIDLKDGEVQFAIGQANTGLKSSSFETAKSIIISIVDEGNCICYDTEVVDLVNFNGYFLSIPLALKAGNYRLTQFLVLDATGNVICASPKEGSAKASLVEDPLPIDFQVNVDAVTKLTPELIDISDCVPSEFGYATFTLNIVKTFSFQVSAFVYNEEIKNWELTDAVIRISEENVRSVTETLEPATNSVTVWDEGENYLIEISKEQYEPYVKTFTLEELKAYAETPLIVMFGEFSGLVAYYPFNGNANDYSGFDNHGVVHGAVLSADKDGNANSAYYFDGNKSYIDIGNSPLIKRYQSDFSVTGWINLYEYSSTYLSAILSNRGIVTDPSAGSLILVGGPPATSYKKIAFVINRDVTSDIYSYDHLIANTQLDLSRWYFFCLTYKYNGGPSNIVTIYVNGVFEASKSMGETLDPGNTITYIGSEPSLYPVGYSFNGCMDEIRIYNKVLDEMEVKYLYENSK